MDALPYRLTIAAALSFAVLAAALTWPLPLHLGTHLTGLPTGDAGVYVWNTWVFRHELVEAGRSPYWTDTVLPLGGPANLALHNYTTFANLLTLPLQPALGVVGSFNTAYLINIALCGLGMFLLAHRVTGRVAESWIAGAMFAAAPFLIARGTSHFSLAAAAPLPVFVYFFDRAWSSSRLTDAAAAGAAVAWAFYCDPYYAVYTVMLAAAVGGARLVSLTRATPTPIRRRLARALEMAAAAVLLVTLVVGIAGGGELSAGPLNVSMRSLYTPVLLLALLVVARAAVAFSATVQLEHWPRRSIAMTIAVALTAAVLLAPELHALATLAAGDRLVAAPVLWRSSAPGADVLSFFIPNPNHPLAPPALTSWVAAQPGRFEENVVSLSYVALAVIAGAWRWAGVRPGRVWTFVTLGFLSLALGPFVHFAGELTYVPTPWTFLRYVPIVGEARMPQRFGIVVFLGVSVLFAGALAGLARAYPDRRRLVLTVVTVALAIELLPAPRPLVPVDVPAVYETIARDPRRVRVLDLPFGVRDGLSSLGDFNASSLVYQTVHQKGIVGGYLSRVDDRTKRACEEHPTLAALMALSIAGPPPSPQALEAAHAAAPELVKRLRLGYVVIDTTRTPDAVREWTVDALELERLESSGSFVLYATKFGRE